MILLKFSRSTGYLHPDLKTIFSNHRNLMKSLSDDEIDKQFLALGMDAGIDRESYQKVMEEVLKIVVLSARIKTSVSSSDRGCFFCSGSIEGLREELIGAEPRQSLHTCQRAWWARRVTNRWLGNRVMATLKNLAIGIFELQKERGRTRRLRGSPLPTARIECLFSHAMDEPRERLRRIRKNGRANR